MQENQIRFAQIVINEISATVKRLTKIGIAEKLSDKDIRKTLLIALRTLGEQAEETIKKLPQ